MKEFTVEGSWWLPETPEARVPGALGFSPDSGASLDLLGSLKDPGDHFAAFGRELVEAGAVLGVSSKGKPVTLWNCLERRKDVNLGGFTKTSFSADVVVVGAHLGDAEEARFAKMSAEYRYLAEWAGISGFGITIPSRSRATAWQPWRSTPSSRKERARSTKPWNPGSATNSGSWTRTASWWHGWDDTTRAAPRQTNSGSTGSTRPRR